VLEHAASPVALTLVPEGFLLSYPHVGIEDSELRADFGDAFNKTENVGHIQMIENTKAKHGVEETILVPAEVAHVVLKQLQTVQLKSLLHESRLLKVDFSSFNTDGVSTMASKLDCVLTLLAGQVKDAETCKRLRRDVSDDLKNAAELLGNDPLVNGINVINDVNIRVRPLAKAL
jgi:hypothetical protein